MSSATAAGSGADSCTGSGWALWGFLRAGLGLGCDSPAGAVFAVLAGRFAGVALGSGLRFLQLVFRMYGHGFSF